MNARETVAIAVRVLGCYFLLSLTGAVWPNLTFVIAMSSTNGFLGDLGSTLFFLASMLVTYALCLWVIVRPNSLAAFIVRDPDATVARIRLESHELQCFAFLAIGLWILLHRLPYWQAVISTSFDAFTQMDMALANSHEIWSIASQEWGSLVQIGSATAIGLALVVMPHLLVRTWTKLQRAVPITGERVALSCVGLYFLADYAPQVIQFLYLDYGVPIIVFGLTGVDLAEDEVRFTAYILPLIILAASLVLFLFPAGVESLWHRIRSRHIALRETETDRRETPLDASGGETSGSSGQGQP